jgi:Uma2 family endonuclease
MSARTLVRPSARRARAKATRADLDALPDQVVLRELLEGEIFVNPSPTPRHQMVLSNLADAVRAHVRVRRLGVAVQAPLDVVFDEHNVAQPDLLFVPARRARKLATAKVVDVSPDLVVEVLSPSTQSRDRSRKLTIYQQHGVKHYWILDPEERSLEEYVRRRGSFQLAAHLLGDATFEPTVFPGLVIDLDQVWV